jgi:1,4-alpha-glucan branching enzyme
MKAFAAQTGRTATGMWLPECAYDPRFDEVLAEEGVRFTIVEEHGLTHAHPRPPGGAHAPIASPSGVAFFGRDLASGRQVWSRHEGYPGDPWYREFYRDIGFDLPEDELLGEVGPFGTRVGTGIKYHRITGPDVPLAEKDVYDPTHARERSWAHAAHFVHERRAHLRRLSPSFPSAPPIIVAPYDAELFGHWWFEGPWFLEGVFRHLALEAVARDVEPITLGSFLRRHPHMARATPAASTWGAEGHRAVWTDPRNAHLWRHVHHGGRALVAAIDRFGDREDASTRAALRQAVVELLLLQASDWPFILRMQTAEQYAETRVREHAAALDALLAMLTNARVDDGAIRELAARDDFLDALGDALLDAYRAD